MVTLMNREKEVAMAKAKRISYELILSALLIGAMVIAAGNAGAQMRQIPVPSMSIMTSCEDNRAVFKIRNGLQSWQERGEIIVVSDDQRRVVSRREMRFASKQKATYRVPLSGRDGVKGPLTLVLVIGDEQKTPVAHARLNCGADS